MPVPDKTAAPVDPSGPTTQPSVAASTARTGSAAPRNSSSRKPTGNPSVDSGNCQQLAQEAASACNNPQMDRTASLTPSSSSSGLRKSCQDIRNANAQAANANRQAGETCSQSYSDCVETCTAAGQSALANQCKGYASKVRQLASQALNNYDAQGSGTDCQENTASGGGMPGMGGMNPQSNDSGSQQANAQNPNDPYGCQQNPSSPACQNCQLNPDSPTCKAMAEGQQAQTGKAGFQGADKSTGGDPNSFNVPETGPMPMFAPTAAGANQQQAQQGHTIPNGGGQMLGGDQGSRPASLGGGGGGGGGGSPGAPGYTTQIEGGMLAGGYSQPGGDLSTGSGGGYNYGRGGPGGGGRMPANAGMDLKRYLPGQRLNPYHMVAGATSMLAPDINGKSVDMFKKISARIQEKCKLGVLFDCR